MGMVIETPHGAILMVRGEYSANIDDYAVQSMCIIPRCPMQQNKYNSHQHHQRSWFNMQAHVVLSSTNAAVCPLHGRPNSTLMSCHTQEDALTVRSIITVKETNENNSIH
jgi:hypothetical protein